MKCHNGDKKLDQSTFQNSKPGENQPPSWPPSNTSSSHPQSSEPSSSTHTCSERTSSTVCSMLDTNSTEKPWHTPNGLTTRTSRSSSRTSMKSRKPSRLSLRAKSSKDKDNSTWPLFQTHTSKRCSNGPKTTSTSTHALNLDKRSEESSWR